MKSKVERADPLQQRTQMLENLPGQRKKERKRRASDRSQATLSVLLSNGSHAVKRRVAVRIVYPMKLKPPKGTWQQALAPHSLATAGPCGGGGGERVCDIAARKDRGRCVFAGGPDVHGTYMPWTPFGELVGQ